MSRSASVSVPATATVPVSAPLSDLLSVGPSVRISRRLPECGHPRDQEGGLHDDGVPGIRRRLSASRGLSPQLARFESAVVAAAVSSPPPLVAAPAAGAGASPKGLERRPSAQRDRTAVQIRQVLPSAACCACR